MQPTSPVENSCWPENKFIACSGVVVYYGAKSPDGVRMMTSDDDIPLSSARLPNAAVQWDGVLSSFVRSAAILIQQTEYHGGGRIHTG